MPHPPEKKGVACIVVLEVKRLLYCIYLGFYCAGDVDDDIGASRSLMVGEEYFLMGGTSVVATGTICNDIDSDDDDDDDFNR